MRRDALTWRKRDILVMFDGQRVQLSELHRKGLLHQLMRERCGELERWGMQVFWDRFGDGWVRTWVAALAGMQCDSLAYPAMVRIASGDTELCEAIGTVLALTRGESLKRKHALIALVKGTVDRSIKVPFKARTIRGGLTRSQAAQDPSDFNEEWDKQVAALDIDSELGDAP